MKRLVIVLAILFVSGSCIPIAYQVDGTPRVWRTWWKIVEACAGTTADFNAWTFAVSHDTVLELPTYPWPGEAWGVTYPSMHVIVLSARGAACGKIVRHEMFHAIDRRYDATHPDSIQAHCAGVITSAVTDARDC